MKLNFKLLEGGILPTRAHKADAGFDLYSPEDFSKAMLSRSINLQILQTSSQRQMID